MTAEIMDGKKVAEDIRAKIKAEVAGLDEKPGLAAIIVGNDGASKRYVASKRRACESVGIHSEVYELPVETTKEELLDRIDKLNKAIHIHGILVQLPLPGHIQDDEVIRAIDVEKDVDGFRAENIGKLVLGDESSVPCTPKGIMRLLESYNVKIAGKYAVVVGRSNIVGEPTRLMLRNRDATVTTCHKKTVDLARYTREAEILIVASGDVRHITGDMVKPGAVVVDVGLHRENGKLVGDVDYASVSEVAGFITPVPGGTGPMTIAMLLENTVQRYHAIMGK
jgi:methylenetetrahydrofolate dehydrogenase (NADP+) / methenyltetrahydrofolate cyclohydrolase